MSETIVHDLEPIEVEIQHGEVAAAARLELCEPPADAIHEVGPVRQSGQRIL